MTSFLTAFWGIAFLFTLDRASVRETVRRPQAYVVLGFVALALLSVLWSEAPTWVERFKGVGPFAKLVLIVLVFIQFSRSRRGWWVLLAFLVSCTVVLIVSYATVIFGDGRLGGRTTYYGVPVKDYISQNGQFVLCAVGLLAFAYQRGCVSAYGQAAALIALALAFLFNVFYIQTSRTALVVLPVLCIVFALTRLRAVHAAAVIGSIIVLAGAVWMSSSTVRNRVMLTFNEASAYSAHSTDRSSTAERLEFWRKSVAIVQDAPILGHGAGSIPTTFARLAKGEGLGGIVAHNAHNQTFNIAIQLGIIGVIMLFAMWITHGLLFRGESLVAWIGLAVVTQNVVGGLFNNHLFDFVHAWIYILGVGVCGGMLMQSPAPGKELEA
ncbi:O-antigen ligase family protein [Variibacter gotjawalensis]|uniref:O-antigen ligase family protein n=1 Tax=Variibacter gotjawalensis TaxID=1333996 RepID=UPI0012FE269B|nr:O-antigen ligase family protein [Variibacter gotjawalensis]NIK49605.1 O-antigen ligase [Variibacter gotjawalensis]